jgi:hypothetical protein
MINTPSDKREPPFRNNEERRLPLKKGASGPWGAHAPTGRTTNPEPPGIGGLRREPEEAAWRVFAKRERRAASVKQGRTDEASNNPQDKAPGFKESEPVKQKIIERGLTQAKRTALCQIDQYDDPAAPEIQGFLHETEHAETHRSPRFRGTYRPDAGPGMAGRRAY